MGWDRDPALENLAPYLISVLRTAISPRISNERRRLHFILQTVGKLSPSRFTITCKNPPKGWDYPVRPVTSREVKELRKQLQSNQGKRNIVFAHLSTTNSEVRAFPKLFGPVENTVHLFCLFLASPGLPFTSKKPLKFSEAVKTLQLRFQFGIYINGKCFSMQNRATLQVPWEKSQWTDKIMNALWRLLSL